LLLLVLWWWWRRLLLIGFVREEQSRQPLRLGLAWFAGLACLAWLAGAAVQATVTLLWWRADVVGQFHPPVIHDRVARRTGRAKSYCITTWPALPTPRAPRA